MNALRILVVEDELLVARDLEATLTRLGFEVAALCRSGAEALAAVRHLQPDVVLMDIQLAATDFSSGPPGMDGVETATRLQQEYPVPVIFLTAHTDESTLIRARGAQPYGYLIKPFHETELRSVIELAFARHHALRTLQSSEERFVSTLRSMAEGVISTDMLGTVNFMNPVAEQLTGWSAREAAGRPLHEVFRVTLPTGEIIEPPGLVAGKGIPARPGHGPEGANGHSAASGGLPDPALMAGNGSPPPASRTILLTDRNGHPFHIEDSTTPIRDADGSLTGIVVLFRRRELPEEAGDFPAPAAGSGAAATAAASSGAAGGPPLSLNEVLAGSPWPNLAGIVSSIADPLLAVDARWRITYLNAPAARVLGASREALPGEVLWDILSPSLHRLYYHEFSTALTRRQPSSFEMEHEARRTWHEVQLYPFGQGLLVLMRDITARKHTEQEQDKLEKLESLGLLARGFAHDFNNLLTVLLGHLSLAELKAGGAEAVPPGVPDHPAETTVHQELAAARRASLQAQNLVQQLLTFARGGAPIRQPTGLTRLISEWFGEWPRRQGIVYRLVLPEARCHAAVDRHQLRRLLANLFRNAEQAQHRGGTITLRLLPPGPPPLPPPEPPPGPVSPPPSADGPEAGAAPSSPPSATPAGGSQENVFTLEVTDTGEGMSPEILSHIFEPYFTTRAAANASGLGLTVCESITKAHGGSVAVESAPGSGTTVRITLPAGGLPDLPPPAPSGPTGGPGSAASGSRNGPRPGEPRRVLVLEDEPLIRQLIISNLSRPGWEVTATPEGSETVARYTEALLSGQGYDLVIMDLSIPGGMGGAQAMEKLREIDPSVRAVVSSGYSDDPIMARHADFGFLAVLPKPYQPSELRELVTTLLADTDAS